MASSTSARGRSRRDLSAAKWAAETTSAPPPPRTRSRNLTNEDDVFTQNAWDDVELSAEEINAAEKVIATSTMAEASTVDACVSNAAALWDKHYADNLRNYHDRNYLQNEFPHLLPDGTGRVLVLETGCGVGNTLLPLLALSPRVHVLGCDHASAAVDRANERLAREGLTERGFAFVWDIGRPVTLSGAPPPKNVDTALAIFTLSALPPAALPDAFKYLAACLKPGGRLLLRDYGRLDLKQLKFAKVPNARLGAAHGCEWYKRGDGTTALFFTTEALQALAEGAGLEVEELRYDKRLTVNRAEKMRMQRVWVLATLRKPGPPGGGEVHQGGGVAGGALALRPTWKPFMLSLAVLAGVAAIASLSSRTRLGSWVKAAFGRDASSISSYVGAPVSVCLGVLARAGR